MDTPRIDPKKASRYLKWKESFEGRLDTWLVELEEYFNRRYYEEIGISED